MIRVGIENQLAMTDLGALECLVWRVRTLDQSGRVMRTVLTGWVTTARRRILLGSVLFSNRRSYDDATRQRCSRF